MIKYKIIWAETRTSCIIKKRTKYCLKYIKGQTTTALSGTLGIMVFKTRAQAEYFITWYVVGSGYKIINVEPIDKPSRVKIICGSSITKNLNKFYKSQKVEFREPPPGTQCYAAVKVLT